VRIDFTPDPSLYPFASHWFDSPAGRLHYVDEGAGPPILFLHGNPTWSFLYRKVITALRGSFRCVAVDYLGFGLSERPEAFGYTAQEHAGCVGELVDHLKLDGFITMGHDWARSAWRSPRPARSVSAASFSATPGSGPPTCR
jgi:haloalkane dehalogenase